MIGRGLRLFSFCLCYQIVLSGTVSAAPTREGMAAQCQEILTRLRGLEAQYDRASSSPTQKTDDEFYRYHLLPDDPKNLVATRDRSKSFAFSPSVAEYISKTETRYQEQIRYANNSAEFIADAKRTRKNDILNVQITATGHEAIACAAEYMLNNPFEKRGGSVTSTGQSTTNIGNRGESSGQQDVNQSIALAQQNQAQGDEQARKKGRREHRPDLDAKECLQLNPNSRLLRNACSYKIEVTYCAIDPMPQNNYAFDVTWAFDCNNRQRFGASTLGAGKDLIGMFPHRTGGGISIAACKEEFPKDVKFSGNQIEYRCRPI